MAKAPASAEGRYRPGVTVGRINVEPGQSTVTVRLWQWSLKPDATLSLGEAEELLYQLKKAITQARPAQEDFSDIA